jgi:cytochrome c biogenesis protein CcmG/thiol:disulfide interchange protein DsbE
LITPRRIFIIVLWAIALYTLSLKVPTVLTHFKHQDQKAPNFAIMTLNQNTMKAKFELYAQSKKVVIIFWATWCGPCEVELKRINEMILEKKIQPSDILAISIQENEITVRETIKKKNYQFDVAIDKDGSVTKLYQVTATPTVVFIDENQIVHWMTSGMSPTLEFRVNSFLNNH